MNSDNWKHIIEQIEPTIIDIPPQNKDFRPNEPVIISPSAGGGVGRFVSCNNGMCMIDVKGIMTELSLDKIEKATAEDTDPLMEPTTNRYHINVLPNVKELLRDKPDPQTGDTIRIENVYGTSIGPGYGVFMSYSTTGEEAIVSFDGQVITVPVEQISSVDEQKSEDMFASTGNDGALSPMSLGSENVQPIEFNNGVNTMDRKDEFLKFLAAIEASLSNPGPSSDKGEECGCKNWDCPVCFPDENNDCMQDTDNCMPGEEEHDDILILDDEYTDDAFGVDEVPDAVVPAITADPGQEKDAPEDVTALIDKIGYMQDMGMSASNANYSIEQLVHAKPDVVKRIYDKVMGNVREDISDKEFDFSVSSQEPDNSDISDQNVEESDGVDNEVVSWMNRLSKKDEVEDNMNNQCDTSSGEVDPDIAAWHERFKRLR